MRNKKIYILSLMIISSLNSDERFNRIDEQNIVIDYEENLMWEDQENIIIKDRNEAVEYCRNLKFAGFDNWRLPFIEELENIHDWNRYNPSINPAFKYVSQDWYWSITKFHSNSFQGWLKKFYGSRHIGLDLTFKYNVKCVRNNE